MDDALDDGVDIEVEPDENAGGFFEHRQLPPDQANPTPHKVVDSVSLGKLNTITIQ